MSYDVAGHDLLSDAAVALTPEKLAEYAAVAEAALGLPGTFTGDDAETAKRAIVYWINCQLAPNDSGRAVRSVSRSKGDQSNSVTYADVRDQKLGHLSDPCAIAHALARSLVGNGAYATLTSLR